ncbi:MAG: response regulator [Campylobacterota bacterium]|nr:response regulator [Campylobacterota bacterium]
MIELNILIVEDELINARFLKKVLNRLKYETVSIVDNYLDAKEFVTSNKVDLIFMDININGPVDGIDSAKKLNEIYPIAVIFVTAYGDSTTIQEASSTNIYGYLIKPFEKQDIEAVLNVAIARLPKDEEECSKTDHVNLGDNSYFNLENSTLHVNSSTEHLTQKESQFLHILVININQITSFETIKSYVWDSRDVSDSTIREIVVRVRKKAPQLNIESFSGLGYSLKRG